MGLSWLGILRFTCQVSEGPDPLGTSGTKMTPRSRAGWPPHPAASEVRSNVQDAVDPVAWRTPGAQAASRAGWEDHGSASPAVHGSEIRHAWIRPAPASKFGCSSANCPSWIVTTRLLMTEPAGMPRADRSMNSAESLSGDAEAVETGRVSGCWGLGSWTFTLTGTPGTGTGLSSCSCQNHEVRSTPYT